METTNKLEEEVAKQEAEFIGMNFIDKPDIVPMLARDGIVFGVVNTTDVVFFVKMSEAQVQNLISQVLKAHDKYNRLRLMGVL